MTKSFAIHFIDSYDVLIFVLLLIFCKYGTYCLVIASVFSRCTQCAFLQSCTASYPPVVWNLLQTVGDLNLSTDPSAQ